MNKLIPLILLLVSPQLYAQESCSDKYVILHAASNHIGSTLYDDYFGYNESNLGIGLGCVTYKNENVNNFSEIGIFKNSYGFDSLYFSNTLSLPYHFGIFKNFGVKAIIANNYELPYKKYSEKYNRSYLLSRSESDTKVGLFLNFDANIYKDIDANINVGKAGEVTLLTLSFKINL